MNKIVMGVMVVLLANTASGAIQFEYFQTSRADGESSDFNARAVLDGKRSRVEFLSGNTYPPGTYVISTDGLHRLLFVDPTQKAYTEVNTIGIASAIGTSNITIENLESSVTKLDDTKVIADIPADHYRLTISFNITIPFRNIPLRQSVRTVIDKWTTVRFGDVGDSAFNTPLQTGNAKVDELIATETTKIRGFPLRQTIQMTTVNNTAVAAGSKLSVPTTRVKNHEMNVVAIREVTADDKLFSVPAGYTRNDYAEQITKSQTQVLSTSTQ